MKSNTSEIIEVGPHLMYKDFQKFLLICKASQSISTFTTKEANINILIENFRKTWSLNNTTDVLVFNITNSEVHINV